MWQHLTLSSLGVIDSAELELGPGFTVITGETGAGKTMVVTALGLLRGDRADLGLVRTGADRARVEAEIAVPDGSNVEETVADAGGQLDDGVIVLGRSLSAQGRSRAFAGGATVPAGLLAEVTDELVAVHGQSDQHRLLRASAQREALDRFAGDPVKDALAEYVPAYTRLRAVERRLDELRTHAQERARELDLLRHGLDEISAVEPVADEDEDLKVEAGRLGHVEALVRAALGAHEALASDDDAGSARDLVAAASAALDEAAGHDPALDALAGRVREISILVDDVAGELSAYADGVEVDPARLAVVQERIAALTALQRKYGPTLADVLTWQEKSAARLTELDSDDDTVAGLEAERDRLEPEVRQLASRLSSLRAEAGERLSGLVDTELAQLSMPSSSLVTRKWWSAKAATCGRCVTARTWAWSARRARRRPTSTAALPPMPASTSSNTSVGTVVRSASTTSSASMSRDSSPPLAPLASGRSGEPAFAENNSSTSSVPCAVSAAPSGLSTRTTRCADGIDS
jgi:DNA repair protein RecN (Recombination protein N)